jgi:hypothetical protein
MKAFLAGVVSFIVLQFFIWLGGYNFDERNPIIAYWIFCTFVFSFLVWYTIKEDTK